MTKEEIRTRVKIVLTKVLKIDIETITDDISQMELSDWDSVRHMNVILALENEFDIEFDDAELPKLTSLFIIVESIYRQK